MSPRERDVLALAADGLTAVRVLLAVAVVLELGTGRTAVAAALVGSAWLSDFFDGRAARASATPTRLGELDLWADTLVGAGAVLGFVAAGRLSWPVGIGAVVVLLAVFALTGNEAMSMILQAIGYGLVLWHTGRDGHTALLVWLFAVIALVAVVNRRVLWERSLPTFFAGVAAVLRGRPSQ